MNITFCSYDWANCVGGSNTWLLRLLPALRERGIESRVLFIALAAESECPTLMSLRRQGFECHAAPGLAYTQQRTRWILERLKESPPDIFVPNLIVSAFFAGRWAREAGIPTVGVMHEDSDYFNALNGEFVFGESPYRMSALVCVSQVQEQALINKNPPDTFITRIPYGVPLPPRTADGPDGCLKLIFAGRLIERQKRISDVTRALCRAVTEVGGTEAVIYGAGEDRANVELILEAEGARLPVTLKGRLEPAQVQECLAENHVLVLLSDYEGLPIVVMEAMACGVVPISLRINSGIPELVEDGITGLLVDDRGDGFVDAVRQLRQEQGLWENLSSAARSKVREGYSIDASSSQWASFFENLYRQAGPWREIKMPVLMKLPPRNPVLDDDREPAMWSRGLSRSRMVAGRVKHKIFRRGRGAV